jgi:hypothetical protein
VTSEQWLEGNLKQLCKRTIAALLFAGMIAIAGAAGDAI